MLSRFLATCLVCISITTFSQSNFIPAIIIKNNGDSVTGKIDYRNWKKNPATINFIGNSNQPQEFDPLSLAGFYIINENERYVSYDISVDESSDQYQNAFTNRTTKASFISKRVFLLQLVRDPSLSLYQYNDGDRNNFYYVESDGKPVGLIYHFLYVEDGDQVQTNDSYKQQLSVLFSSCQTIANKANDLIYTAEALKKITGKYLACQYPTHIADIKKKDSISIKFGVIAGAMYNKYNFVGRGPTSTFDYSSINLKNYNNNVSPVIGVSLDIGMKRNFNKLHIVNELIYKKYSTHDSGFTHTALYDYTNKVSFAFSYLQLNTIARYFFGTKNTVKPFINIGMGNAFMISEQKNSKHLTYTNGQESETEAIPGGVRKYEPSGLVGAGVSFSKIVIEARYGFSNGFSPYVFFKSKVNSFQLLATWYFK